MPRPTHVLIVVCFISSAAANMRARPVLGHITSPGRAAPVGDWLTGGSTADAAGQPPQRGPVWPRQAVERERRSVARLVGGTGEEHVLAGRQVSRMVRLILRAAVPGAWESSPARRPPGGCSHQNPGRKASTCQQAVCVEGCTLEPGVSRLRQVDGMERTGPLLWWGRSGPVTAVSSGRRRPPGDQ